MAIAIKGYLYEGLAVDIKPTTNVPANTRFLETDTSREYLWNGVAWTPTFEMRAGRPKWGTSTIWSLPGVYVTGVGARAIVANRLYYFPFQIYKAKTLDQLLLEVTAAGAALTVARMGIYAADLDWQPGALILDAGAVAVDSTGVKSIALAQALSPGQYLLCVLSNGAPTLRTWLGSHQGLGIYPAWGPNSILVGFSAAQTYGALPNPGPAWGVGLENSATPFEYMVLVRESSP